MKKKIIPAIIAIALIIIVGLIGVGTSFIGKYSYSDEKMNLKEYYSLSDDSSVAIVLQNEILDTKAKLIEGVYYLDFASVQELLNARFYVDEHENLLIYTTALDIVKNVIGTDAYVENGEEVSAGYPVSVTDGETLYVALDYVKKFTDFSYDAYTEPNRIVMRTEWGTRNSVTVKKETAVRVKGGVKSEILREVDKGESLVLIEEMDDWDKVKTEDGFIGYVEKKKLSSPITEEEIPVSECNLPEYTTVRRDHKINMGWHAIYSLAGNDTFETYATGTGSMNVISPTWISMSDNEGNFRSYASSEYCQRAHSRNMEVWASVDNFNAGEVSTYEIMSYTSKRERLISNLIAEVKANDIDGINMDFEQVPSNAVPHYVEFLRELSVACRKEGIVLSVDNYPPQGGSNYNLKEQGVVADYVVMMGYDEHWGGCEEAGSVASIGYVETGLNMILEVVPAEKVINGIPFYTRVWKTSGGSITSEALGMVDSAAFISKYGIETSWDETTCQNYGEIEMNGVLYQVWMEDAQSIETKLNIMDKYGIAGVAEWQLGLEDKSIWNTIDAYMLK